jgi:hypothetical protein
MIKFEVGDKVRVVKPECGKRRDAVGIVVEVDACSVGVEFKGWRDGHDGPWTDGRKSCWNFYEPQEQLVLIRAAKKVDPKPVKPSQAYLGNGKHKWEDVVAGTDFGDIPYVKRLRVPGGWLYKVRSATVLVPMPEVVKHKV